MVEKVCYGGDIRVPFYIAIGVRGPSLKLREINSISSVHYDDVGVLVRGNS